MRFNVLVIHALALASSIAGCIATPSAESGLFLDASSPPLADAATSLEPALPTTDASTTAPSASPHAIDAGGDALLSTGAGAPVNDAAVNPPFADASFSLDSATFGDADPDADEGGGIAGEAGASDAQALEDAGLLAIDAGCTLSLGAGALVVDELMIESVSGSGDYGEWLEVSNATGCAVDLLGLHAATPHGSKVTTLDILSDVWLPAGGAFIIADANNVTVDHNLGGLVFEWLGSPSDVLRNEGATVTLSVGSVLVDAVTYPALKLTPGVSYEFPASCASALRSSFSNWVPAASSWFPGFFGTPNAPNTDVPCP